MSHNELPRFLCPLCPLHCDDLAFDQSGRLDVPDCPIANGFQGPSPNTANLELSHFPGQVAKVITSGVDLVTAKRLIQWHQSGQIQLLLEADPSIAAIGRVTSRDGIVACTLSEITARADWVMTIGDVSGAWPRFAQRVRKDRLLQRGATWIDREGMSSDDATQFVTQPMESLLSSQYAVLVIGPGAFPMEDAERVAAVLARWVRDRNAIQRAHLITLDAAATLKSVSLWRTNSLPPMVTTASELELAPQQGLARVGSPPRGTVIDVDVQVGGMNIQPSSCREYQPAAMAGWNFTSAVIRGDGSVTLPLRGPVHSDRVIDQEG